MLLITEDLDELLMLSDKIAVLFNGSLSRSFDAEKVKSLQNWFDDGRESFNG